MEILDRAEALLDKAMSLQDGDDGKSGDPSSNGASGPSPLSIYLSTVPQAERADRELELRKTLGLCAGCRALAIRDDTRGCGHPEIAALGSPTGRVRSCGNYDPAEG